MPLPFPRAPLRFLLPLPAALLACGGAPPPEPPKPPPALPVAPQAPPPPSAPKAVAAPRVGPLEAPPRVACRLPHRGPLPSTWRLRLTEGGAPFASIGDAGAATVLVPTGPLNGLFVEVEAGGVRVRGWIDGAEAPLYPARSEALGGALVPLGGTALTVTDGAVDSLTVRGVTDEHVRLAAPITGELPCAAVATSPGSDDPFKPLPAGAKSRVAVRVGARALYKEMTGDARLGEFVGDTAAPYATAIGAGGARTLVAWPIGPSLVFGYLDRKDVALATETAAERTATPTAEPRKAPKRETGVATFTSARCTAELPLLAEVGGARREVGVIPAGARVQLGPEANGVRLVALPDTDLLAADAGKLFVTAEAAKSCP